MAKRSTIGENPLDAVVRGNPLDTVVPDLRVVAQTGPGQPAATALAEIQERVQALETGLKTLGTQVAAATAAVTAASTLKDALGGLQKDLAQVRREVEHLTAGAAAAQTLAAEVTRLKEELAQIRAAAGPGDLPWWMRGKKR
jgi:predicted RNase H-like nuclease (RuvC/YqgF family)